MNPELVDVHKHMLELGLAALRHANWHANFFSFENPMWPQLSVLQAAHAAEILIKSRIAQEHPLLIFEQLPRSTQVLGTTLNFEDLLIKAKTIQFNDLPERLWAVTGIKIQNLENYKSFGNLRNSIQHFADPRGHHCGYETVNFIYEVIEPLINECWGLYAIDYNEDSEEYIYLIECLINNEVEFLVPPKSLEKCIEHIRFDWKDNSSYKMTMIQRFSDAGYELN